jgi:hypothetical protein
VFDGVRTSAKQLRVEVSALYPTLQTAAQLEPWLTLDAPEHDGDATFEISLGAAHGFGEHEKVDGVNVPRLQDKADVLAVYPVLQAVSQLEPWLTLDAPEQDGDAVFAIPFGAAHGFGEHEKVDGVKIPRLQDKTDVLAVYPTLQAASQSESWLTLAAPAHDGDAAFSIPLGAAHRLGEHEKVDGVKVPRLQAKVDGVDV